MKNPLSNRKGQETIASGVQVHPRLLQLITIMVLLLILMPVIGGFSDGSVTIKDLSSFNQGSIILFLAALIILVGGYAYLQKKMPAIFGDKFVSGTIWTALIVMLLIPFFLEGTGIEWTFLGLFFMGGMLVFLLSQGKRIAGLVEERRFDEIVPDVRTNWNVAWKSTDFKRSLKGMKGISGALSKIRDNLDDDLTVDIDITVHTRYDRRRVNPISDLQVMVVGGGEGITQEAVRGYKEGEKVKTIVDKSAQNALDHVLPYLADVAGDIVKEGKIEGGSLSKAAIADILGGMEDSIVYTGESASMLFRTAGAMKWERYAPRISSAEFKAKFADGVEANARFFKMLPRDRRGDANKHIVQAYDRLLDAVGAMDTLVDLLGVSNKTIGREIKYDHWTMTNQNSARRVLKDGVNLTRTITRGTTYATALNTLKTVISNYRQQVHSTGGRIEKWAAAIEIPDELKILPNTRPDQNRIDHIDPIKGMTTTDSVRWASSLVVVNKPTATP